MYNTPTDSRKLLQYAIAGVTGIALSLAGLAGAGPAFAEGFTQTANHFLGKTGHRPDANAYAGFVKQALTTHYELGSAAIKPAIKVEATGPAQPKSNYKVTGVHFKM